MSATITDTTPTADTTPETAPEAKPAKVAKPAPAWKSPLTPEAAKAIAATARPAVSPCLCGCGGQTKGRFVPGHDATLKEQLKITVADSPVKAARDAAQSALASFGW